MPAARASSTRWRTSSRPGCGATPVSPSRSSPSSRRISVSASRPVAEIVSRVPTATSGSLAAAYLAPSAWTTITDSAVGDHVVHLAGDPRALVPRGQLHLTLGHPLGLLGARDQRGDVPLAGLGRPAERPRGGDDRADRDGVGREVARGEVAGTEAEEPAGGGDQRTGVPDEQCRHALPARRPAGDGVDRDREGELPDGGLVEGRRLEGGRRGDREEDRPRVAPTPQQGQHLGDGEERRDRLVGQRRGPGRPRRGRTRR